MKKFKLFIALSLIALCAIFVLSACSQKSDTTVSDIVSVELNGKNDKKEVQIKAEFTEDFVEEFKGEKVYLIANNGTKTDTVKPIAEAKVKGKITFEIPYEENGKNYMNTSFVCAVISGTGDEREFTPVTSEKYITNISEYGESVSRPSTSSIKGLAFSDVGHASCLGVQHMLLEVRIDEILLTEYQPEAQSVISQGKTYYFDGEYVEALDKTISEATRMGIRVYLQFTLGKPDADDENAKEIIECLYFNGSVKDSKGYLPNVTSAEARGYLNALFDFTACRYSGEHGVAIDYIIGENANDPAYNNAGDCEVGEAKKNYLLLVRMANNSLRSRASNGKVYISLDNDWRRKSNGALSYLNTFNENAKATGDFGWSIALSFGQMSSDSAWADNVESTEEFTADTLIELEGILGTDRFMYETETRDVIISSFSLKTNPDSENSNNRRAASYAYLYYSSLDSGIIDALIYSSYISDSRGLMTADGEKTALYDTFAVCSSSRSGELQSLNSTIGSKWTSLQGSDSFEHTAMYYIGVSEKQVKTTNPKRLFDFENGTNYGFVPLGGADFASLCEYEKEDEENPVGTKLLTDGDGNSWRVIYTNSLGETAINDSKNLGVIMNSANSGEEVVILIKGQDKKTKDTITLCATAVLDSAPKEYFFDISDFSGRLDSGEVEMLICTPMTENSEYSELSIYRASLYGSSGTQIWKYVLIAIIIIVITVALFFVAKFVINKTNKPKKRKPTGPRKSSGTSKPKAQSKPKTAPKEDEEKLTPPDEDEDDETYDLDED